MVFPLTLRSPKYAGDVARQILVERKDDRVFAFHGELGTGKTTLIKALCQELGVLDGTSSPSYAIVNEYRRSIGDPLYHLDLYRLQKPDELEDIGFTEYVDSGYYCFIEWPELAEDLLPPETVHLKLNTELDGSRTITLA